MAVRHYKLEYTTNGGSSWIEAVADETPGPNKVLNINGLASGTYAVKLRLVPLTGDPSPIVSDEFILQIGVPATSESLFSFAEAVLSVTEILARKDTTSAVNSVIAVQTDVVSGNEAVTIVSSSEATVADIQQTLNEIVENIADYFTSDATVIDYQNYAEGSLITVSNEVSTSEILARKDTASIVTTVLVTESDTYTAGVSGPTQPVVSATAGNTTVAIALTSGGVGATSYEIHWGTTPGSRSNTITWAEIQADAEPDFPANPFTHTGRTNGTTYYYSLVAINAQGSTESIEVSATPVAVTYSFTGTAGTNVEAYSSDWTRSVAGSGTVQLDGSGAVKIRTAAATDAALMTRTAAISRNTAYTFKMKIKLLSAATFVDTFRIFTYNSAAKVGVGTNASAPALIQLSQFTQGSGTLRFGFYYKNTAGALRGYKAGTGWQNYAGNEEVALAWNTYYTWIMESDGTNVRWSLKDGTTETTTYLQTSWVPWSDVYSIANAEWLTIGDWATDFHKVEAYIDSWIES